MTETAPARVERVTRRVAAPAATIFDLLADPRRHGEIDGSGSVVDAADGAPERLALGTKFGMSMKIGVPYKISNEVVEFDEGRRIAWRHMGGHIWRYTLEPDGDSATQVTEEFDWRPSRAPLLLRLTGAPARNRASIEQTLEKLAARFEQPAP